MKFIGITLFALSSMAMSYHFIGGIFLAAAMWLGLLLIVNGVRDEIVERIVNSARDV